MRIVLDKCALIELKCSEIYRHLAQEHSESRRLQALWLRAAEEEEHHARQFKMISRLKGESIESLKIELCDTTEMLESLDSLLDKLKSTSVTPVRALQLAVDLETNLNRFHANSVTVCKDQELAKLLDAMMNFDLDHVRMFEKELEEWLGGQGSRSHILNKVEELFQEIKRCNLTPVDTLKVAINFEKQLSKYFRDPVAGSEHAEMQHLLESMIEKNQGFLVLVQEKLARLVAERAGNLSQENRLARAEHRPEWVTGK